MPQYKVTCTETVVVDFFVESPHEGRVIEWLSEEGADVAAELVQRRTVLDRDFEIVLHESDVGADYNTEEEDEDDNSKLEGLEDV